MFLTIVVAANSLGEEDTDHETLNGLPKYRKPYEIVKLGQYLKQMTLLKKSTAIMAGPESIRQDAKNKLRSS